MMTDPIADLLNRIRNALRARKPSVEVSGSRIKVDIVEILKEEGFIADYEVIPGAPPKSTLRVVLKYGSDGEDVITQMKRESKPSCRRYLKADQVPRVLGGMGICILSTPKGILSDRRARKEHVGGELICSIW